MRKSEIEVFGIPITTDSREEILEYIQLYLQKVKSQKSKVKSEEIEPLVIFTPNPEIIMMAQKDRKLKEIVRSAQINIPDGAGVVWAIKQKYGRKVSRIPGVEMMRDLVRLSAEMGLNIGLIGGREEVAVKTLECLKREFKGMSGEVIEAGEIEMRDERWKIKDMGKYDDITIGWMDRLIEKIERDNISVLFVGLGCPKQEYIIQEIKNQSIRQAQDKKSKIKNAEPLVLMAVGGSFDFISGRVPRASQFMRNLGLEWLYRLFREPWRVGRMISGAEFFGRVIFKRY